MRTVKLMKWMTMALALGCVSGCATSPELEPSPKASGAVQDRISKRVHDIEVTAEVDAWPGWPEVKTHVTPLKITIDNDGTSPIRLSYADFQLRTVDGERFGAVPPIDVDGEVTKPAIVGEYRPVTSPGFIYDRYYPASYYAPVYTSVPSYRGPFYFDPDYYRDYRTYWRRAEVQLPTPEMLQVALLEGVLDPGGVVSGFLYFEKVDQDLERVTLTTELVHAESGEVVAEVAMPFVVER